MANIGRYGGKVTVTASTTPSGHKIETVQSSNLPSWVSDIMTGTTWSGNVAPNETTSERSFRLNVKVTTNPDSQYEGVANVPCAWTVTQEGIPTPTDRLQVQLRPNGEFEATACTAVLMIDSNTAWTISTNVSWIVINNRTGSETDERPIEIKPNIGDRRTGLIMVVTTNGLQQEIEVEQRAPSTLDKRLVLGMDNMSLSVNETRANTAKFYATINGQEYLINQDVSSFAEWRSSNESVATVSGGHVTGVSSGFAEVWATYNDATSQDCYVNVQ